MKIRIVDIKKAEDAVVSLYNVPFLPDYDKVSKALATLGSTPDEVSKIVKLNQRTNQAYYFNFTGDGEVLKKFFEQYYNHKTWDEIQAEYPGSDRQVIKKDDSSKDELLKKALGSYFKTFGITVSNIKYNSEKKEVLLYNLDDAIGLRLSKAYFNDIKLHGFFKKYGFDLKGFINNKEPKRFLLKSI